MRTVRRHWQDVVGPRLRRWGVGWVTLYVGFLPGAAAAFLPGFEVVRPDKWEYAVTLLVIVLSNLVLVGLAASWPSASVASARLTLMLSPVTTGLVVLFGFPQAVAPGGALLDRPWGLIWGAQLLIGSGWTFLWLPRDYTEPVPDGFDQEKLVKSAHDEYQSLVWPAVAIVVTSFLATLIQVTQVVASSKSAAYGVFQALVVVLAGAIMSLAVLRILEHVTATRWLLASGTLQTRPPDASVPMPAAGVSIRPREGIGSPALSRPPTESSPSQRLQEDLHHVWRFVTDVAIVVWSLLRR